MVRIVQTVAAGASEYERRSQRVDFQALSSSHEVMVVDPPSLAATPADVAHIYGAASLPASLLKGLEIPFLSNSEVAKSRFMWRKSTQPAFVVTWDLVPEAIEEKWFVTDNDVGAGFSRPANDETKLAKDGQAALRGVHRIGTFGAHRAGVKNMIEQTIARLQRFRDDLEWHTFTRPPSPEDLAAVDVWVDPATSDNDLDGFVAEAYVVGKALVASRTPINIHRLEKARCGFLVPPNDPNELGHAILTALFKPEVARLKIQAAKQTAGKFRPRQRLRVLERMYETLIQ